MIHVRKNVDRSDLTTSQITGKLRNIDLAETETAVQVWVTEAG